MENKAAPLARLPFPKGKKGQSYFEYGSTIAQEREKRPS